MNPFKFGAIVTGEYFTDRLKEIKEITSDIKSGQHIILMSSRRYGKSSLINKVIKKMGIKSFRIDMELIADEIDFTNYYVRKALSLSTFAKIKFFLKKFRIQPSIQIQPVTNEVSISFNPEERNVSAILADSLELPEIIARNVRKRIVIVFDEFQEVRRISSELERKMRGIFQHHQNVTYIFIGSQESMIREIFQNRKNPFYKFGRHITLDKIPELELESFVKERFMSQDINADKIVEDILIFTNYHPFYTQQLCHQIYILANDMKALTKEIVESAIEQIIIQHHADYLRWWDSLTNTERKVIIGIASGDKNPTSNGFIRKYGIRSSSSSGSVVSKLIASGILLRNKNKELSIEDPFWKEWIIRIRNL